MKSAALAIGPAVSALILVVPPSVLAAAKIFAVHALVQVCSVVTVFLG